ncbi:MAG TPA: LysR substrate-binding domain-containing protein [Telmatospirillum sp.]|nr:LysR substrate-binding domain-containing protein [Telmatospirillum sp.]
MEQLGEATVAETIQKIGSAKDRRASLRSPLLELDLLRTLIAVHQHASFTEAAHALNKTQAAVSIQIRRLEELAGVSLIDRGRRTLRFTDDGESLLAFGRKMLTLNDEALASVRPDQIAGSVRLGAVTYYAVHILPPLLAEFSGRYPAVRIEVLPGVSFREAAFGADLDLVIALEPAGTTAGTVLVRERAVWVTSARHQTHRAEPLPLAVLPEGSLLRKWAIESLEHHHRAWRIAYISANASAMRAAIEAGLAVGVIRAGSMTDELRELTEEDGFPALPLFDIALTDAGAGLGRVGVALRDFLLQKLAWGGGHP